MNCFAAGMFLSIALMHMLPESVEMFFAWAEHEGIEEPFQLPYCTLFVGYLIPLFVDKVIVHNVVEKNFA